MNNYESFKTELLSMLADKVDFSIINIVSESLDKAVNNYDIVRKNTNLIPAKPDIIKMFIASKLSEGKTKTTIKTYYTYLSKMINTISKPVEQITSNDIRLYLYHCQEVLHYKDSTVQNIRRIANNLFEWCVLEEIIRANPCKRIKPKRCEKHPVSAMKPIELEYMRKACKDIKEKALIDFLYSTGCRVSELCRCKLNNIDWEQKTVYIEHGKGNVSRLTFLNPESEVSLKAYLESRKDKSEYLFAQSKGMTGKALSARTIQVAIKRISQRVPTITSHITPHVFRHTVATCAIKNGMPIEQVQRFLGHANINTTMIYAEVDIDEVRHSHAKYCA